jgi:K+-transporting ATPase ATPase A chain
MRLNDLLQLLVFGGATVALVVPLGVYMAHVFSGKKTWLDRIIKPLEHVVYKIAGVRPEQEQSWAAYLGTVLLFNAIGGIALFAILLIQDKLPWNPQHLPAVSADLAFNIAVSFITNTNWQSYTGETTLSYFSQMLGLTVQNFLSAATGMAVAIAVIRGFMRKETRTIGNFYVDLTRAVLYVLLPLALIFALILVWQGVPMNMKAYVTATTLEQAPQIIAEGPVASQMAIMELGTNGGGFFNANGAHPYQNPTPLSNFLELISLVAIAAAFVITFGRMIGDKKQGRALLASMTILFIALFALCYASEAGHNPAFTRLGINQSITDVNPGGNMEGKEVRFGIMNSALWSTLTTATSNGSVNAMHDSFTPLGGMVPLFNMLIGEVIYGGVGCGLYGILIYVLVTVFIAGLMVGRTPEYLGKKIEAYEIKLSIFAMLLYPLCVLGFGVAALLIPAAAKSISVGPPHGLTQAIYAYASAVANNGSAFAGFNGNTVYQNVMLGIVILLGRFGVIAPVLAIAGSLAAKKTVPATSGTLPTHGLMFIVMLTAVILMFGGLTYFPALALGPIAEHLSAFTHPAP